MPLNSAVKESGTNGSFSATLESVVGFLGGLAPWGAGPWMLSL